MRVLLVGGGTAGHMLPLVALIKGHDSEQSEESCPNDKERSQREHLQFAYVGEGTALEKTVFKGTGIKQFTIKAGKFRRYFSFKNLLDFCKVPIGFLQSLEVIRKFKPDVIFSKGGYVAVPVVMAGWVSGVSVVIHESDAIPGLASSITASAAKTICVGFKEAAKYFPKKKVVVTGTPVRKEITKGSAAQGQKLTGFTDKLPVVLVMGGSQGAAKVNTAVHGALKKLLKKAQVIHIAGKGKKINTWHLNTEEKKRYKQFEFVTKELPHLYKIANLIVSRAGANALAEIEVLGTPHVLVPLGKEGSRGDQIENAKIAARRGCPVIPDAKLTAKKLTEEVFSHMKEAKKSSKKSLHTTATAKILKIIGDHQSRK